MKIAAAMGANKPGRQGEHEVSRKPLRRECRLKPVKPVATTPCIFCTNHGGHRTPGIPCALFSSRDENFSINLGVGAPGDRGSVPGCLKIESEYGAQLVRGTREPE